MGKRASMGLFPDIREVRLQPRHRTAKGPSADDQVKTWMGLMAEWDALSRELETARKMKIGPAEADVLARMQAVKERIDTFLGNAARERRPIKGPIVMGTFTPSSGEESD